MDGGKQDLCGIVKEQILAYIGRMDKASHAYGYRKSERNAALYTREVIDCQDIAFGHSKVLRTLY